MKRPATMSRPMRIWRRTEPRRRARKLLYQWIGRRGSVSAAVLPFCSLSFREQRPPLFRSAAVNPLCILGAAAVRAFRLGREDTGKYVRTA